MVSFGRRNNKLETLSRPSRYASTPLEAPGNMYTSRRREEVDADGDLDDLIQQEIQRYEELFHPNNRMPPGLGDDDTLQDGSIYTSMQASNSLLPTINKASSQDDEDTMWGLENDPVEVPRKPASTSLLNSKETFAAQACQMIKPKSKKKLFVPPIAAIPVDNDIKPSQTKKVETTVKGPPKRSKSKFFAKRLLGKSSGNAVTKNSAAACTPRTQASTPATTTTAPKMKLFSPVRFLKPSKKKKQQQQSQHQNLLLASMIAGRPNQQDTKQAVPQCHDPAPTMHHRIVQAPPPSPPPPIATCEFRWGDGASVGSAHSSLTDALDAWMIKDSPPRIIGGNHMQTTISPYQMEAYEGGLTPYLDPSQGVDDEEASTGSPGALLLTEQGLHFHNQNGKALSPVRPPKPVTEELENEHMAERVWANKGEIDPLNDSKTLTEKDVHPEDASNSAEQEDRPTNVKRNLFGANEGEHPLEYHEQDDQDDAPTAENFQENIDGTSSPHKPSKFKKFLNKLVSPPKAKQAQLNSQLQKPKEQDRSTAPEEQLEKQRLEEEEGETKRTEQKGQQEMELLQKLEMESQNPASNTESTGSATSDTPSVEHCPARSFSLMCGDMKPPGHGSECSFTADITSSNPTVQSAPSSTRSMFETPKPGYSSDLLIQATPSSSYLVNFQFHRREGDKVYTMAYSVDSSLHEDIKWKEIVNAAWKEDRRVVKSGVFSAIQAESISKIQQGQLEMRFELPFWGKHASQTLGPKTLDLLLDVVGPHRPVQVTISLEEPHVAAGVDDDGAPDCLF